MTNFELWINLTVIVLLIPTVFYTASLSRKLCKMQQNQERMIELAQALRRAAETYAVPEKTETPAPTVCHADSYADFNEPHFDISRESEPLFEPPATNEIDNLKSPFPDSFSANGTDQPSDAELELLQALRSIK